MTNGEMQSPEFSNPGAESFRHLPVKWEPKREYTRDNIEIFKRIFRSSALARQVTLSGPS